MAYSNNYDFFNSFLKLSTLDEFIKIVNSKCNSILEKNLNLHLKFKLSRQL